MVSESHGGSGMQGPVVDVLWIQRQQFIELGDGIGMLVSIQHHAGQVASQFNVVRSHRQRTGQQYLGIIEYVARYTDARQQAHALYMISVSQQKGTDQSFRR